MRPTRMTFSSQLRAVALIALFGVLVFGCGSDGEKADGAGIDAPSARTPSTTLDVTYVVTGATEKGAKRALAPGSEIRLAFSEGQLRITAGCNSMSGAYRLDGSRLSVESLATTEMGCDQPLMEQDAWVAGLFAEPVRLTTGNDAAIISGDVVLTLADREQVSPDKPLVGTTWVLDSIGSGGPDGAASSVPQGVEASFRIAEDGTVTVNDGCNGSGGTVEVEEATIVWSQRDTELKACLDPGVRDVEAAVSEVLAGRTSFTLDEKVLRVTKGDRFLGFRASP